MEIRKILLYVAFAFIAVALWSNWNNFQAKKHQEETAVTQPAANAIDNPMQGAPATVENKTNVVEGAPALTPTNVAAKVNKSNWITVNTDLLQVAIDLQGGNIVSLALNKYPETEKKNSPAMHILTSDDGYYVTQSGVISKGSTAQGNFIYTSAKKSYALENGQNQVVVTLNGKTAEGFPIEKTYTFSRDKYSFVISSKLTNNTKQSWTGNQYLSLVKRFGASDQHNRSDRTYAGAALSSSSQPYHKISYADLTKQNINQNIHGGWLALQQKYFIAALVPEANEVNHYYSLVSGDGENSPYVYTLGYAAPETNVAPGASLTNTTKMYVGPEIPAWLEQVAPYLSLTIDYGWLWWLSEPIYWVLSKIYKVIGNWGWSIIVITILIKLLLHPFTHMSFKSMGKMKALAPKIEDLKKRHGDDKQAFGKAQMELYRLEKVNPLGGCLPMLLQVPFFIALYYVLVESVQLRHAPWILWIHDLSVKDPYYILPVIMGLSMLLQQKLSPPSPDPAQAKMMMFLPLIFIFVFLQFPAGLVIYWIMNNVITAGQMWWAGRHIKKHN